MAIVWIGYSRSSRALPERIILHGCTVARLWRAKKFVTSGMHGRGQECCISVIHPGWTSRRNDVHHQLSTRMGHNRDAIVAGSKNDASRVSTGRVIAVVAASKFSCCTLCLMQSVAYAWHGAVDERPAPIPVRRRVRCPLPQCAGSQKVTRENGRAESVGLTMIGMPILQNTLLPRSHAMRGAGPVPSGRRKRQHKVN